jgi:hypothetical protein
MGRNLRGRVTDEWMQTGKAKCTIAKHFYNLVLLLYAFFIPSCTLIFKCSSLFPKYLRSFVFNSYVYCTCLPKAQVHLVGKPEEKGKGNTVV